MPIRAGSTPVMLKSGRRSAFKVGNQGAVAAAAFAPTDIAGLVAWYDFSDITTLWKNTGRTSAVTADADVVKGVTDKSGSARHLSEATNGPTYKTGIQNGKSVLRFDGTNDTLAASGLTATPTITYFVVVKEAAAATATNRTLVGPNGNCQLFTGTGLVATGVWGFFQKNLASGAQTLSGAPDSWAVVTMKFTSTASASFYYNGGTATTFDPADSVSGNSYDIQTTIRLGSNNTPANFGDYDIGEYLQYDSALSDGNRASVGTFLQARWATP